MSDLDFNSIKVRLELSKVCQRHELQNYFNSIKVRLELDVAAVASHGQIFQFHKGTIRTLGYEPSWNEVAYFNSIKVRLERCARSLQKCAVLFQFHKGTIRTDTSISS